jgi:hypothetical protein
VGAAAAADLKAKRAAVQAAGVGGKRRRPDEAPAAPAGTDSKDGEGEGDESKESRRVKRTRLDTDRDPYRDADKAARTVFLGNLPLALTSKQLA